MRPLDLLPDCRGSCAALCCVEISFDASEAFAFSKPAGVPCPHLTQGLRCSIHEELVPRGFGGCAAYTCYGAGQRATRAFANAEGTDAERRAVFLALSEIHELLWLLTEGLKRCPASQGALAAAFRAAIEELDSIAQSPWPILVGTSIARQRESSRALLRSLSPWLGVESSKAGR